MANAKYINDPKTGSVKLVDTKKKPSVADRLIQELSIPKEEEDVIDLTERPLTAEEQVELAIRGKESKQDEENRRLVNKVSSGLGLATAAGAASPLMGETVGKLTEPATQPIGEGARTLISNLANQELIGKLSPAAFPLHVGGKTVQNIAGDPEMRKEFKESGDEQAPIYSKDGKLIGYRNEPDGEETRVSIFGIPTISPKQARMIGSEVGSVATGEGKVGSVADVLSNLLGGAVRGVGKGVAGVVKPVGNLVGDVAGAVGEVGEAALGNKFVDMLKSALVGKKETPGLGGLAGLAKELVGQTAYGQVFIDPAMRHLFGESLYESNVGGGLANAYLARLDQEANRISNKQLNRRTPEEVKFLETYPENRKAIMEASDSLTKQTKVKQDAADDIRKEVYTQNKDVREVKDKFSQIVAAAGADSGAGDTMLINTMARMASPGIVTEQDFRAWTANAGLGQAFQNILQRWNSGERLSPTDRESIVRVAAGIYSPRLKNYKTIRDQYKKIARDRGLNPDEAVAGDAFEDIEEQLKVVDKLSTFESKTKGTGAGRGDSPKWTKEKEQRLKNFIAMGNTSKARELQEEKTRLGGK